MKLSKFIKNTSVKLFILAVISILTAQSGLAQIRIGGIKIPEINIPIKKGTKIPEPKPESTNSNNQTNTNTQNNSTNTNTKQDETAAWLENFIYDIKQAQEEVESYTVEGKMYLVSTPLQKWLVNALSAKAREEWAKEKKVSDWLKANPGNKFETALAALAASATQKLPNYIPNNNNFAIKDASSETMMKGKLKNSATLKIIKIGMFHANWQIEKNDIGIPKNRYREGFIWGKDSADDHNFCHLYGFVIQQDYSGGGTYGATWAYLNTDTLFGCPTK